MRKDEKASDQNSISASNAPGRQWSPRRVRLTGYLVGFTLSLGLLVLVFWLVTTFRNISASTSAGQVSDNQPVATETAFPSSWERPVVTNDGLAERSGVRIVQVALTGEGGLIDVRFQVIDADKAHFVHDPATPPLIVDAATGLIVDNLLMGHAHTGTFTPGQTYYLIFENPGNIVQRGSQVSILLGDAEVDNVTVR